jgi:cytochrome oxidase Cu insertion factor (SCO1/SenC/PrrC family)
MLRKRTWLLPALAALVLTAAAGGGAQNERPLGAGEKAPDFTLKSVDDKPVTLSELSKKNVVLVNFFFNG